MKRRGRECGRMKAPKPTLLQASMIMMLAVGMTNHVFIIPALLQTAGRDAWISLILSGPFVLFFVLLLLFISKAMGEESLSEWTARYAGQATSYILRALTALFCLMNGFSTLYETTTWTRINFLLTTPTLVTSVLLMLICFLAVKKGLKALAGTSGILLPITFFFGFCIAFINTKYKDYNQLLPVFEHGFTPSIKGTMYSMAGTFELFLILFLQQGLSSKLRLKPMLILALIILGFTMGPLVGAITEFNPYEAKLVRFPAYEEWRLATVGKFISQTDFLSIFQWISGAFIRIALLLYVTVDVWNIKSVKQRSLWYLLICALFVMLNLLPLSDILVHRFTVEWLYPANLIFITGMILFLTVLGGITRRRKQHGGKAKQRASIHRSGG